ncbi:MAG: DUF1579 domain-containing protein [Phycisphaerales bacterium]|nr:DUF1579 domain-containing protein [Phycisphaerales bacterium]MCB9855253.1 DUF1579 domain-containing protein [Phycisphaerales bacterium]MCB9862846.1 DUF1579 domain-containing protein [Phycisphaerales bacterium]
MKKRLFVLALVAGVTVLALANTVRSGDEEKKPTDPTAGMSPEAIKAMEACMKMMEVSEHHEQLKHFVGEWNLTMRVWHMPGQPPMESPGTSTIKSVLGGRFLLEEFKSNMMGMPYEGIGMQGYNNTRGVFEGTWTSTMDTHIYTMKGTQQPGKDGKNNVFNYYGEMDEPAIGILGRHVNYRTTIIDKDHHKFEIFDLAVGPDFKVIEIEYARK